MAVTVHVYQIYISSPAERVWQAITDSEWTRQYFHTNHIQIIGKLFTGRFQWSAW